MTKLLREIFFLSLLIIFFCQNIDPVTTLRCAHFCAIESTSFGTPDPIKTPCNTTDIDTNTTICSVFLVINYRARTISAVLNERSRTIDKLSTLHLSSKILPEFTETFINYQCATTDECDQDFVRETISSTKMASFR